MKSWTPILALLNLLALEYSHLINNTATIQNTIKFNENYVDDFDDFGISNDADDDELDDDLEQVENEMLILLST